MRNHSPCSTRPAAGGRGLSVFLRLARFFLLVACALVVAGCGRSSRPAERRVELPAWTAELPGRAAPLAVTLPAHLDAHLPRGPAEYVLRTRAEVPAEMRGVPLTLAIPHMPAMATLRVDGATAVPVDASTLDSYRASGPLRWRVPEEASKDGALDLELRVSHRFTRTAFIDAVPALTTDPLGGSRMAAVHAFNTIAATGALASAIVVAVLYGFLFLSLRDARRASYGWFAVGATCGMAYPAFVLGLTQPVFGTHEASFMTIALVLGSIAAMCFTRAYVAAPAPSRAWWGIFAAVVVAGIVARDPFVSIVVMGPIVVAVTLANAFAQLVFLARLRREAASVPRNVYAIAFAWPATVLLGLPDILAWTGQGEPSGGVRTACLGIMALSLYQATALSREHLFALKRADELVADLAERVKLLQAKHREVELLNDELRRQIAARSRELAEKLARMDDGEGAPAELPELAPGDVIEGRYRIERPLGSGGMGTVYEVERVADGKHFALKALAGGGDAQARARFAREAQIVANVKHPNVVAIVDVDVAKSGFIFLVMELVAAGATLHDVRRRHRDVPWTLGVLAQVAEGIDAIHGAGIIHRDLKPGNILLSRGDDGRRPNVKITDFGISSLQPDGTRLSTIERAAMSSLPDANEVELDPFAPPASGPASREFGTDARLARAGGMMDLEYDPTTPMDAGPDSAPGSGPEGPDSAPKGKKPPAEAPLTETGIIFGTPQYMAQELTTGTKNATRASDVFSLGIIAFEVLTGKRPFPEAPVSAKLAGRPLPKSVPFRTMVPTLPPDIAKLLDRAMSHDPRERPTAKELAAALRAAADKLLPRAG